MKERADDALAELLRVVRPGGYVLISVMSLLGSLHAFLSGVSDDIDRAGIDTVQRVVDTGDLPEELSSRGVVMRMYTWEDLDSLLRRHPCEVVVASAANFLSVRNDEECERLLRDPEMWERFLAWEVRASREPGVLDAGTHIIAVVRRVSEPSS